MSGQDRAFRSLGRIEVTVETVSDGISNPPGWLDVRRIAEVAINEYVRQSESDREPLPAPEAASQ